jgi:hypothetical protein
MQLTEKPTNPDVSVRSLRFPSGWSEIADFYVVSRCFDGIVKLML